MANLPQQHPTLSLHLTDRALTPLVTSAPSQGQLAALSSLTQNALTAYESAQRLGLGSPQRVLVEHCDGGPVLLNSFLSAQNERFMASNGAATPAQVGGSLGPRGSLAAGEPTGDDLEDARGLGGAQRSIGATGSRLGSSQVGAAEVDDGPNAPPMLTAIVIAPSAEAAGEARVAAGRLERVGREVQARWAEARGQEEDYESG